MTEQTIAGFNSKAEFDISILSGGKKTCKLRWPTDEEWAERSRGTKIIQRTGGRSQSQSETGSGNDQSAVLFSQIRLDKGGVEFDSFEAAKAIARREKTEVLESELAGEEFTTTIAIPGGEARFTLTLPRQRDIVELGRRAVKISDVTRRSQAISVLLEPSAELFDRLVVKVEGYAENVVPIIHKAAVAEELLAVMRAADDDPQ